MGGGRRGIKAMVLPSTPSGRPEQGYFYFKMSFSS